MRVSPRSDRAVFVAGCSGADQALGAGEGRKLGTRASFRRSRRGRSGRRPTKELFGREYETPAPLAARTIGFYSPGLLAGGQPLPIDGPAWEVMRLSRNRNWGHPTLSRSWNGSPQDADVGHWHGLLVGDM